MKLHDRLQRDKQKRFLVHGHHIVYEALKAGLLVEIISTYQPKSSQVPVHLVTRDVMDRLSVQASASKIMGVARQKPETSIDGNAVIVYAVHHPGNLGTIIRSGVAFDADTIIVEASVDVYNPKVVQASQGMIFYANIVKGQVMQHAASLKEKGYRIYGADVHGDTNITDVATWGKWALVLGNESEGVPRPLLDMCDKRIRIGISKRCESLNVGVAAGILLHRLALKEN